MVILRGYKSKITCHSHHNEAWLIMTIIPIELADAAVVIPRGMTQLRKHTKNVHLTPFM